MQTRFLWVELYLLSFAPADTVLPPVASDPCGVSSLPPPVHPLSCALSSSASASPELSVGTKHGPCRPGMVIHKYHLQNPVSNEGDREGLIIAYISAARLFCITDEARLLIIPDIFSCYTQNKHSNMNRMVSHIFPIMVGGIWTSRMPPRKFQSPCLFSQSSYLWTPPNRRQIHSSISEACYLSKPVAKIWTKHHSFSMLVALFFPRKL